MDSSGHPTFKYFTNGKELEQWSNFEIKIERKYLYTCFKFMSNNQKIKQELRVYNSTLFPNEVVLLENFKSVLYL